MFLLWVYYRIFRNLRQTKTALISKKEIAISIAIILLWVWFSGIGGFAFQNWDHHFRNAVFHDLINYPWPVKYSNFGNPNIGLVYYLGYWLPSALIGKLLGWQTANVMLFIWSFIGIAITIILLKEKLKISLIPITLVLVFFSGMDILGQVLLALVDPLKVSTLWPPISHLEWWAYSFQFTSMTTQLFWIYNQAIPTWVCIALYLVLPEKKYSFFLWSLCLFLTPMTAIGFLPFIVFDLVKGILRQPKRFFLPRIYIKELLEKKGYLLHNYSFILDNLFSSLIILFISCAYFFVNSASTGLLIKAVDRFQIPILIIFLVFECLPLIMLIIKPNLKNSDWYLVLIILVSCPLFLSGSGIHYSMRVSIPALFYLMVLVLESISQLKPSSRTMLLAFLLIGAITPVYEINRSIFRSIDYLINFRKYSDQQLVEPIEAIQVPENWEDDHPFTLLADNIKSFSFVPLETSNNFLADMDGTFFLQHIAKEGQ
ncbi:MAG TPA: hypothetical protein PK174_01300 [Anaerolineaceae bacterium]|nr:hypothetical protein [Anaerolineaceae bacterium]